VPPPPPTSLQGELSGLFAQLNPCCDCTKWIAVARSCLLVLPSQAGAAAGCGAGEVTLLVCPVLPDLRESFAFRRFAGFSNCPAGNSIISMTTVRSNVGMIRTGENRRAGIKIFPSATVPTTIPTTTGQGSNSGARGDRRR